MSWKACQSSSKVHRFGSIGVHRNERSSRKVFHRTLAGLIGEPRCNWRRPISYCVDVPVAPAQRSAPPGRERANKAGVSPLLVDPRSRSSTVSTTQDSIDRNRESEAATNSSDSFVLSWTSSLTSAMRYILKVDYPSQPASPPTENHHGLLYADAMMIAERPHIKYDWTIGKRLKSSCTVYYAEQFDALRRTCGVEDVLVRNMAKCEPAWKAQGGKTRSRSNFCKTSNDRFIIKTLVNAWNIDQLYVVLFIPDGRQTKVEQPREKNIIKFPSTSRPPISCL
jgi:hypothetical protein